MGKGMPARIAAAIVGATALLLWIGTLSREGKHGPRPPAQFATAAAGDDISTARSSPGGGPSAYAARAARFPSRSSGDVATNSGTRSAEAAHAPCKGARRAELSRLRAMHARPGDPDESIDAALVLLRMGRKDDAADLLGAASDRWPRDPDLAWFAWSQCDPASCDRAARLRRVLALEPDNAVAWMYAVEDAWRRHDDAAVDAALERAARAPIYATHEGVLFLHGLGIATEMSLPDACVRAVQDLIAEDFHRPATAQDVAILEAENMENRAFPPAYAVVGACRPSAAHPGSRRRAACIALLPRLASADTLLERDLGAAGLLDLLPDLPRSNPWRESYRQAQWLGEQLPKLALEPEVWSRMHAEGGWNTIVGLAKAQGLWPAPPCWLPSSRDARARVAGPSSPETGHTAPR